MNNQAVIQILKATLKDDVTPAVADELVKIAIEILEEKV